jgi:HEAT repeat protein
VEHVPRLLGHSDVRVRRETVRALGRLNSLGTIRALAPALCDADPPVRILAANAVARKGRKEHAPLLLARIEDRTFLSLSPEEMEAFLGAYAQLAQDRAVPLLEKAWKKGLLSSKPAAYRAAAVHALGRVRSTSADEALKAAGRSDDPQIRRAATDAVQRRKNRLGEEA